MPLKEIEESIKKVREQMPEIMAGVEALAEIDTAGAPVLDTNAGDVGAVGAGLIAADTQMQTLIETLTKQSEEAAKRAATAQKGILATITRREEVVEERRPLEEITRETLAEFGLTPVSVQKVQGLMGQLTSYNQQIVDLEAQKQQQLLGQEQQLAGYTKGVLRGQQALIERQYNSNISAKAAQAGVVSQQIQMERGLWDDARTTANMIVSAATYDQQQQLADLDWARDTYQDIYNMETQEARDAWDKAYTLTKDNLAQAQDDWNTKLALNQRAAEAGVNLGWDSTYMESHTVEELNAEYAERVAAIPEKPDLLSVSEAKSLGVPYGTTRAQAAAMGIVPGVGVDWSTYFSPDQLRQITRAGIDLSAPEGIQQALEMFPVVPETDQWTNTESYIQQNIQTGATSPSDMTTIYTTAKRNNPKLTDSDIKALMAQYGMVDMYGMWVYMPPAELPEVGEPLEGEEIPRGVVPGVSPWVGPVGPAQVWKGARWLWGKVTGK